MQIKDIINMENGEAVDWLVENQDKFVLTGVAEDTEESTPSGQTELASCIASRDDSDRLDQLRDMLMQASYKISDDLGLPSGWMDLRDALDGMDY